MSYPPESMASRVDFLNQMAIDAQATNETLLYVRIPGHMDPLLREQRFEEPLNVALTAAGVGEVAGGGSQPGDDRNTGYSGVDVYLRDRATGLQLLRKTLRRLNAPDGTVIEEFLPKWQEHAL